MLRRNDVAEKHRICRQNAFDICKEQRRLSREVVVEIALVLRESLFLLWMNAVVEPINRGKHRRCRSKKMLWLATCIISEIGISFSLEWAFEKKTSHHLKINQKTHNLMSSEACKGGKANLVPRTH